MIKIIDISKSYKEVKAVKNVNLQFSEGYIFGLLGRNGSGKSTIFRMILNLISQDEGEILYNGEPITKKISNLFGYLPEERSMYLQEKVLNQIVYFAKLKGMSTEEATTKAMEYIHKFNLDEYKNKKLKTLSKGNQQKVSFIASIIHDPKILILDEPLTGFDPINSELIKKEIIALRDSGRIIIFSSHQMHNIEDLCTDIAIINKGEIIIEGSLKDIRKSFGKNQVEIIGENIDLDALKNIEGVISLNMDINGLIKIKTNGKEDTANRLFKEVSNLNITKFEVKEPTIHQIFVDKVGESNE